jgi:flagellar biosynthetic protein FliR
MADIFTWNEAQIFTFFFVLVRTTSLIVFLPLLGDRGVPVSVKILFGLGLAVISYPLVWGEGGRLSPEIWESAGKTIWAVAREVMFGMMLGFVARWIFDAVQVAGHFAGTTMGFSIASVLDPHTEAHTIALAELQYVMAALLFLALDGHHIYVAAVVKSFKLVPLAQVDLLAHADGIVAYLINMTGEVLALGLKLAAPVVVIVLLVNITFGLLSRAVPAMNVMAVSFTASIVVGLIVVLASSAGFMNVVSGAFDVYTPELFRFMRLVHG